MEPPNQSPDPCDCALPHSHLKGTAQCAVLDPADCPQPAPHAPRKEERARCENLLEIHRRQLGGISRPVSLDHCTSRIGDQSLKREDQQKNVIDFTEERDEIRDYVDGEKDVCNRSRDDDLVH